MHRYLKFLKFAFMTILVALSVDLTIVSDASAYRAWVPGHWNYGAWIPGHYVGGGYYGRPGWNGGYRYHHRWHRRYW